MTSPPTQRVRVIILALILLVSVCVLAWRFFNESNANQYPVVTYPTPAPVTFIPPTARPTPIPTVDRVLGQPAPDVSLATLDGAPIRLRDLVGEIVFLNFWATWCLPCREEMPTLQRFQDEHSRAGVRVITITDPTEGQTLDDIRAFMAEHDLTLTVALSSDRTFYQHMGIDLIPTTLIMTRDGVIRYRHIGELHEHDMLAYLD